MTIQQRPEDMAVLKLARDWKAGDMRPVHPSIGLMLNRALVHAGEDAVPFRRSTSLNAPSVVELIRTEYVRAASAHSRAYEPLELEE